MLEQGTICLIPIPFTDSSSSKKRPVLVVSNNNYNKKQDDILVMAMTSNLDKKKFSVLIEQQDMETGVLKETSLVRVDKVYSISKGLVIKKFGKINKNKFMEIVYSLNDLIKYS